MFADDIAICSETVMQDRQGMEALESCEWADDDVVTGRQEE